MFRVLALDGGGVRGVFTAAVLAELEDIHSKSGGSSKLMDYFDLVVGTSTGGIIALALGLEIPAATILDMYMRKAGQIFPQSARTFMGRLKQIFATKYDDEHLRQALIDVFQERILSDVKHPVAVPAFNASTSRPVVFKSSYLKSTQRSKMGSTDRDRNRSKKRNPYAQLKIVKVAMATSAAPTFFCAQECENHGTMIDGGVWANCPAMVGVVEAIKEFKKTPSQISVLGVGTMTAKYFVKESQFDGGQLKWAADATTLVMHATKSGVVSQVEHLIGDNYIPVDEEVPPGKFPLDGAECVKQMCAMGKHAANNKYDDIRAKFLYRRKTLRSRSNC